MKSTLNLESVCSIPPDYALQLDAYRAYFLEHEFLDDVLKHPSIGRLAQQLEGYLKQQLIEGYHCTKEPTPGYFEANGLRVTDLIAHQAEFLQNFHQEFSSSEIKIMKSAWSEHFLPNQVAGRNGLVWMVLSRSRVKTSGTKTFFRYFGGESVFKPLLRHNEISEKLEKIGRAVVVEVAVPGHLLTAHYDMSKCVLSNFHKSIRGDAYLYNSEASSKLEVPPAAVIKVTPLSEFNI